MMFSPAGVEVAGNGRPPSIASARMAAARRNGVVVLVLLATRWLAGCGLPPSSQAAAMPTGPTTPVALLVAPEEDPASMLAAIRTARRRVLVEMYMLTAAEAIAALLDAHAAGADVRVLLEPAPYGDVAANEPAFVTLTNAGVDVRWTHRAVGYVHAKMVIVDGRMVYVMTLNLSSAGLRTNREYLVADGNPAEVRWAETIWNADATGAALAPAAGGPTRLLVSGLDARARLGATIAAARSAIAMEMEELSDAELTAGLLAARARGVTVTVVAPAADRSPATTSALARLADGGARVGLLAIPTVHAKAMAIDGARVYVGSMNFTRASLDDNREIGLLWSDPAAAARITSTVAADFRSAIP